MNKLAKELLLITLALMLFVLIALNTEKYFFRFDITEDRRNSISSATEEILREFKEPITITYYVSDSLRQYSFAPQNIEDLLQEYAAASRGNLKFSVVDPADAELDEELRRLGITPRRIQVIEENEEVYTQVYSGIVIRSLKREKIIPAVFRLEHLEYQLTVKLKELLQGGRSSIGVMIGNKSKSLRENYSLLANLLSSRYEVREVPMGQPIRTDIDVLFVLGGSDLSNNDLRYIDQFLMTKGRAFFGIDGVKIDTENNLRATKMGEMPVLDYLAHYGVEIQPSLVLDTSSRNFRLPRQSFGGTSWEILGPYPHWIQIRGAQTDPSHPVTEVFPGLDLLWPSPIRIVQNSREKFSSLAESSAEAWLMEDLFFTNPYEASDLKPLGAETAGQYTLAAAMQGELNAYFPQELQGAQAEKTAQETANSQNGRLLVIGDSDFASNLMQYSDSLYNLEFILNCAEWLQGEEELLKLRSRASRDLGLNKLDPQQGRAQYLFSQFVNMILLPIFIIGFGFVRYLLRRKQQRQTIRGSADEV